MTRFARLVFVAAAVISLMAYAFDCEGMQTPERAMQCCNSMPCSSQRHHEQDCCKSMPSMHKPFVQVSASHDAGFSLQVLGVLPTSAEFSIPKLSAGSVAAQCHAPPIFRSPSPLPLRI
jgi:hypothetical protein